MIELERNEQALAQPLFAGTSHSVALVQSIFEGDASGRVFVDRRDSPSVALIDHEVVFKYLGGRAEGEARRRRVMRGDSDTGDCDGPGVRGVWARIGRGVCLLR